MEDLSLRERSIPIQAGDEAFVRRGTLPPAARGSAWATFRFPEWRLRIPEPAGMKTASWSRHTVLGHNAGAFADAYEGITESIGRPGSKGQNEIRLLCRCLDLQLSSKCRRTPVAPMLNGPRLHARGWDWQGS